MAKILVVDDNPLNATLARLQLAHAGHDVAVEPSGAAALARLDVERPDLVLTDIAMPGMSGVDLLDAIRARSGLRTLPVLAHTSFAVPVQQAAFRRAGFDAIVVKPATREALVAAVDHALGRGAR
ncbi:MAG: response regulator [Burkholderiales bacterium]|nr:response regulator [Burkholderiales bacterium]MCE7875744.1 response regulator [Betaproteobacteria bacterium PRO3]